MKYAKIIATGSYLPQKILTNDDLAQMVDTSDEWITQRTGIKQRYVVTEQDNAVTMGAKSARIALDTAGIKADDLDMIIVATCTSEQVFPSTACLIQAELGMQNNCPAFDLQAACSGFIYALSVAMQFIAGQQIKRILVIGTEAMSKVLDWKDRSSCILFGDGAGAVILEASDTPGILSAHLNADGNYKDVLSLANSSYIHMMVSGKVVQYTFTIIEGWRTRDVIAALHEHPKIKVTLAGLSYDQILKKLDLPVKHLEGLFLADTYFFHADTKDVDFLRRAYLSMQEKLDALWEKRAPNLALNNPYEALILASIIEKESGLAHGCRGAKCA